MHRGYIKLWRKTFDSDLLKNRTLWTFWSWCLLKASYQEHSVLVGYQEVLLQPGQFIFGRKVAVAELTMTEREVRTCIKALANQKKVTIKATNKFSIVSIINWDTYQQENCQSDQQSDQQATSKRPASDQQATTNKKDKKDKNKEIPETSLKEVSPPSSLSLKKEIPAEITTFVQKYMHHITATKGNLAPKTPSLKNKSEETVEKLVRLDKFQLDYIREVLLWASKDDFWKDKILSLASLRKASAKNDLTKFQNIAHGYEASKQPGKEKEVVIIASPAQTTEQLEATIERFFQ